MPKIELEVDPRMVMELKESHASASTKNMVVIPGPAVIYVVRPGSDIDVLWCNGPMEIRT